jgi:two-component system sensor histidine kinase ChiS
MNTIKVQKSFFYIMLLIMAVSIAVPGIRLLSAKAPEAVNGTLDLKNYDLLQGKTVKLNGEWEFYFGKLLTPEDFKNKQPQGKTIQKVPAKWSSYQMNGLSFPTYGTATYRLRILLPANSGNYGIKITSIYASTRIFADGQQILTCGKPGNTPETTEHKYYADAGYFTTNQDEVELVVQAANYISAYNGIFYEIYFGDQQAISKIRLYDFFIDAALISGMFFMSLYFLGLGLQRKNNLDVIFFALYCFFSAVYDSTSSEALLNYAFPVLTYNASVKIQVLAVILSLFSLYQYAYQAFKASYTRDGNKIINGIVIFFILLTCFTNFYLWRYTYIIFTLGNVYIFALVFQIVYRHLHTNIEGRYYLYTALISSITLFSISLFNIVLALESNLFIPVFQPVFVLSIALYMSEKYENSYKTIEKLSNRLVTLDKLKDDFLAKTSHDLKTPLNGIINISQSLLDGAGGSLNPAQAEDIRLITSIGKRLSVLVYDILDYSKLKVMDFKLNTTCLDVHQVAESTVEIFRYLIKGRSLTLENKIPPKAYLILADENRLKQIITNLLDNSIKFTEEGSITLSCRQDGEFLWIEVSDTGSGIPENKLKDIFTAYEQLEEQSADVMGTGLGLAITKQLVALHQGRIQVQSKPGEGTCFAFSLPLVKDNKALGAAPGKYEAHDIPQPLTVGKLPQTVDVGGQFSILAVDDEYSNLKALLNILTVCKYNVTVTGNAEAALALLQGSSKYDLCILDVMMPGMSGYEACRKIRETYSPLELPVLLLTAKALSEDLEAGFRAGANDFIEKPFEAGELKCRVNTLIQLKGSMDLLLEKETAFLQAQIRPHFLFNALNTISSFCYTDPAKAGELLSELGVFLRNSFDFSSTSSFIPIEKELRLVRAYVAIEQARFGKQLEVAYNIDPAVLKYSILPLMIQPIVENSIRHGLMKRTRGGKVTLNLTQGEDWINVQVIDNGVGIPELILKDLTDSKLEDRGVGLRNIRRRLLSFYGVTLSISSTEGRGTTVSFNIPVKYS